MDMDDPLNCHSDPDNLEHLVVRITREALDTEPSGRADFVRRRCGDDSRLHDRVESLLRSITAARPPTDRLSTFHQNLEPPQQLGPFLLTERIGQGGMSDVWRGERIDGVFLQSVAVKLMRNTDPASPVRFQREQEILARLNHVNIAHLLDGGLTDTGQPWLALEHVQGEYITRWCDQKNLSISERARLLIPICSAIQFAHQNLVIHRDIKPANILINSDGVPKLLDFGIAKLLDTENPDQTQTLIMTPAYAAPEQRSGGIVTTSVDIYQLGLILRELLTGIPPTAPTGIDVGRGHIMNDSSAQSFRALLDRNPDESLVIARQRRLSTSALLKALRGDIGRIIAKATADDPAERYGTAKELSDDLERWLGNQPVRARRSNLIYRTRKFLRRNRLLAGVTALLSLSLLLSGCWPGNAPSLSSDRGNGQRTYWPSCATCSSPIRRMPPTADHSR